MLSFFCIIRWVLSHYKEGISHHFQNFSQNLNIDGQNSSCRMVSRKNLPLWQDAKREISLFWTFFNLTCMILYAEKFSPLFYFRPLNDLAFRLEGEFKTWLIKSYIKDCVRNRVDEFKARWNILRSLEGKNKTGWT